MEGKVSLQDLAQSLSNKRNIQRKDADFFVKAFFEIISEAILRDKIVKIKGLGTFKMIEVQERESVNVNTGERIVIPGHSKISFTPDSELKDKVNKPFALFQTVIINEGTSLEEMEKKDGTLGFERDVDGVDEVREVHEVVEEVQEVDNVDEEVQEVDNVDEEVQEVDKVYEEIQEVDKVADEIQEVEKVDEEVNEDGEVQESKWWHISSAMLALLFAFFWIVLLIGYLIGKNNWVSLEQLFNQPEKIPVVKVDTIYVVKTVKPDTVFIQAPEASKTITTEKAVKPVANVVIAKKNGHVAYEIVGQKGVRTIKWGDYLLKIVRQEYGNDDALRYVISYNKFTDPDNLPVGTEVKLPKLKEK